MLFETEKLEEIRIQIDLILEKILEYENRYNSQILSVHPNYTKSAKNLIHYLALRSFDNAVFQDKLNKIGLPNTSSSESSVLHNLLVYKTIIHSLLNNNEIE
jgi:pyruvate kinase